MARFGTGHARLVSQISANAGDEAARPIDVTVEAWPATGSVAFNTTIRTIRAKGLRPFDQMPGQIARPERNAELEAVFLPDVVVHVSQRLTVTAPADMAGQVYEIVLPFRARPLGYRVGLSLVSGNR
jgi:hypothetical protein